MSGLEIGIGKPGEPRWPDVVRLKRGIVHRVTCLRCGYEQPWAGACKCDAHEALDTIAKGSPKGLLAPFGISLDAWLGRTV